MNSLVTHTHTHKSIRKRTLCVHVFWCRWSLISPNVFLSRRLTGFSIYSYRIVFFRNWNFRQVTIRTFTFALKMFCVSYSRLSYHIRSPLLPPLISPFLFLFLGQFKYINSCVMMTEYKNSGPDLPKTSE